MNWLTQLVLAFWQITREMSPYLLLGFLLAGLMHAFIPAAFTEQLRRPGPSAVWKAVILGVPLPVCSCGVIPLAAHMKKTKIHNSVILSFLISTPTTGVDSILATYALLGPLFALIRPFAALIAGLFAGLVYLKISKNNPPPVTFAQPVEMPAANKSFLQRLMIASRYGFSELVSDVGRWVLTGLLLGALITTIIPERFVSISLGRPWLAYPFMLLLGVPMYVCATGSIPVAASLIWRGMLPGAAMVFLFVGPATNLVTLFFVTRSLGKIALWIYLGSIITVGTVAGLFIDTLYLRFGPGSSLFSHGIHHLPASWQTIGSIVLLGLIFASWLRQKTEEKEEGLVFSVPEITCQHCARNIRQALLSVEGINSIRINLKNKTVSLQGDFAEENVIKVLAEAGYKAERIKPGVWGK